MSAPEDGVALSRDVKRAKGFAKGGKPSQFLPFTWGLRTGEVAAAGEGGMQEQSNHSGNHDDDVDDGDDDDEAPEALDMQNVKEFVERKEQGGREGEQRILDHKAQRMRHLQEIESRRAADRAAHAATKRTTAKVAQHHHELPPRLLEVLETLSSPDAGSTSPHKRDSGESRKPKRERGVESPKLKKKLAEIWDQAGIEVRVADEKKYVDVQLSPDIEAFVKQREALITRGSVKSASKMTTSRRGPRKVLKK